jgi:FMN phosphatase YigB (HAD superfamily)
MIKAILFDLDGTLLPMDQDKFIQGYIGRMCVKMAPYGYDPQLLSKAIWKGTAAMIKNDGTESNETVFWNTFSPYFGKDCRLDDPLFREYYQTDFQKVQGDCGFDPRAAEAITEIKALGYRLVLATNPLFPAIATYSRVKWAGLNPEDFELITTYENSRHCKPNPEYYRDILATLDLKSEDCVMVGNDVSEDMITEQLGMRTFLMTDCLINRENKDITRFSHGSFPELLRFIREL